MFKLWSEINDEAKSTLKPDFGLRSWNDLSKDEKYRVWRHLEAYFFSLELKYSSSYEMDEFTNDHNNYYPFYEYNHKDKRRRINFAINSLYHSYKARNYAKNYLAKPAHFSACTDFYNIFSTEEANVVLELLSLYCLAMIEERYNTYSKVQNNDFSKEQYSGSFLT